MRQPINYTQLLYYNYIIIFPYYISKVKSNWLAYTCCNVYTGSWGVESKYREWKCHSK
jgi:hypothetical protein